MAEFFKKRMGADTVTTTEHRLAGKRSIIGTIEVSPGRAFRVLREDILQKGLARGGTKRVA